MANDTRSTGPVTTDRNGRNLMCLECNHETRFRSSALGPKCKEKMMRENAERHRVRNSAADTINAYSSSEEE